MLRLITLLICFWASHSYRTMGQNTLPIHEVLSVVKTNDGKVFVGKKVDSYLSKGKYIEIDNGMGDMLLEVEKVASDKLLKVKSYTHLNYRVRSVQVSPEQSREACANYYKTAVLNKRAFFYSCLSSAGCSTTYSLPEGKIVFAETGTSGPKGKHIILINFYNADGMIERGCID